MKRVIIAIAALIGLSACRYTPPGIPIIEPAPEAPPAAVVPTNVIYCGDVLCPLDPSGRPYDPRYLAVVDGQLVPADGGVPIDQTIRPVHRRG